MQMLLMGQERSGLGLDIRFSVGEVTGDLSRSSLVTGTTLFWSL